MAEQENSSKTFNRNPLLYLFINIVITIIIFLFAIYILGNTVEFNLLFIILHVLFVCLPILGFFTKEKIKIGIIAVSVILTVGWSVYMFWYLPGSGSTQGSGSTGDNTQQD